MDRRLICPRAACAALLVVGAAGLLAGCASAGTGGSTPSGGFDGPLTSQVEAWADVVVPENALGGASWVARDIVVLRPEDGGVAEEAVDVTQSEGEWLVQIACLTTSGGAITVRIETHDGADDAEVPCSTPADDPFAPAVSLPFSGSGKVLLTFGSEQRASAVYAVYPDGEGQR